MRNLMITLLTITMLVSISFQSLKAQTSDNQLYAIRTIKVEPSKDLDFQKAMRTFVASLNGAKLSELEFYGNATSDYHYYFAQPIDNYAELDKNSWTEAIGKLGEERFVKELSALSDGIVENRIEVYLNRTDLTYIHPSMKGNSELNYRVWDLYKFESGSEAQVEQLCKEWKALFKKHDLKRHSTLYFPTIGADANVVVNLHMAKDPADFTQKQEEFFNKTGDEGQALWQKTQALMTDYRRQTGAFRMDLSVIPTPENTATAEKE